MLLGGGIKLPAALRLLYRFKNGQHFAGWGMQGLLGGCGALDLNLSVSLITALAQPAQYSRKDAV